MSRTFKKIWSISGVVSALRWKAILEAAEIKMTVYEAIDRSIGPVTALNDEATLRAHDINVTPSNSPDDASPTDTASGVVVATSPPSRPPGKGSGRYVYRKED